MDLFNPQNWNLLRRANYESPIIAGNPDAGSYSYLALRDVQTPATSPILMVGITSTKAKKHWKTGGWVSMWLPFLPGSTTEFTATVRADNQRCYLHQLNLIQFPKLRFTPYIANLSFPYWLEQAYIEIWQFGENPDGSYSFPPSNIEDVGEALQRIEMKVDNLSQDTFNIDVQ